MFLKMRELHGILSVQEIRKPDDLKPYLLYFDKLRFVTSRIFSFEDDLLLRHFSYLIDRGILHQGPSNELFEDFDPAQLPLSPSVRSIVIDYIMVRHAVSRLAKADHDAVGIFHRTGWAEGNQGTTPLTCETALSIGFRALPAISDTCAFEDILNFKQELRDKHWNYRRFLKSLATKHLTESEIQDEIERMVNEYKKAMEIHHIKASQSFVDVFVISPLEIIENLVKFNWSKIAKGALQVQKRKVELLEAEMKAPGRECAYVFDAQKRFGTK